jgi:2-polyprenyl-6-methoxyphenol hydroxylase-like FAD-dependent oxidoreductase
MTYTAVIAGGGISGSLSAIALHKAGISSVVYEAYDRGADHVGAFLTLAVNALDALRALDLDLDGVGFDTPRITMTSGSGRRLGELPYGTAGSVGPKSRTVKRADLYRALRDEAVRADEQVALGRAAVGADGLRSRTREIIDPHAPAARYAGLLNTGGYAHGVSTGSEPGTMHAIFGKRCFFVYTVDPYGEVWWMAQPARADEPAPAELAAITQEEWRTHLIGLFRDDRGPAVDLITATAEIFTGWNTYDLPTVPRWHRDRMIVIGDAAHATSSSIGQGAAMAIEDTVVLATCLRDGPGVDAAFATYERQRRRRVERVVEQGKRTGDWKALGPLTRGVRDLIMGLAMKRMARTGADPSGWIYDHHLDWDTPVVT